MRLVLASLHTRLYPREFYVCIFFQVRIMIAEYWQSDGINQPKGHHHDDVFLIISYRIATLDTKMFGVMRKRVFVVSLNFSKYLHLSPCFLS